MCEPKSRCCEAKVEKKRVLFLDFAGVINHANEYFQITDIDPECVRRVVRVATEAGADVVLSTPMRGNEFGAADILKVFKGMFEAMGVSVIGELPTVLPAYKEQVDFEGGVPSSVFYPDTAGSIRKWLQEHKCEVAEFCILSGIDFFGCLEKAFPYNFVGTLNEETGYTGITDEQAEIAIAILTAGGEESSESGCDCGEGEQEEAQDNAEPQDEFSFECPCGCGQKIVLSVPKFRT